MRKTMTKEVTHTTLKCAKMSIVDGSPVAEEMEDEIMLGNVSQEKAQKHVAKKHGAGVTVFEVIPDTQKYKMEVEEFIKLATPVTDEDEAEEADEDNE